MRISSAIFGSFLAKLQCALPSRPKRQNPPSCVLVHIHVRRRAGCLSRDFLYCLLQLCCFLKCFPTPTSCLHKALPVYYCTCQILGSYHLVNVKQLQKQDVFVNKHWTQGSFVYCSHGGSQLFRKYRLRLVGECLTF